MGTYTNENEDNIKPLRHQQFLSGSIPGIGTGMITSGGGTKTKFNYNLKLIELAKKIGMNPEQLINFRLDPQSLANLQNDTQWLNAPNNFGMGLGSQLPTSYLGTPIFNSISLRIQDFTNKGNPISEFVNLDCAFLTINQKKNVIKTPINGYRGMVKEIMSIYDYDIKIEALIAGNFSMSYLKEDLVPNTNYNLADGNILNSLVKICNYSGDIQIGNDFLSKMFPTIINITIDEVEFSQSHEYSNIVMVEISACDSDILPISY